MYDKICISVVFITKYAKDEGFKNFFVSEQSKSVMGTFISVYMNICIDVII